MGHIGNKLNALRLFGSLLRCRGSELRQADLAIKSIRGGFVEYECPICGYKGGFGAYAHFPIFNSRCFQCQSVQRHRLLYLTHLRANLFGPEDRVLHFAPEQAVTSFVSPLVRSYETADLAMKGVDHHVDIENLSFGEASYDVVICSHVLEHVNDIKALDQIRRILSPQGRAIIMVPIAEGCEKTFEDATFTSEDDRVRHYRQNDHVRLYGRDFRQRVQESGLNLEEHTAFGHEVGRYGLEAGEKIFICRPS